MHTHYSCIYQLYLAHRVIHTSYHVVTIAWLLVELGIDVIPGAKVGVRVGGVAAGGPAEQCGLLAGDVILQVTGEVMRSAIDFRGVCKKIRPAEQLVFQVQRTRTQQTFTLNVAAKGVKYDDILRLRRIAANNIVDDDAAFIKSLK